MQRNEWIAHHPEHLNHATHDFENPLLKEGLKICTELCSIEIWYCGVQQFLSAFLKTRHRVVGLNKTGTMILQE